MKIVLSIGGSILAPDGIDVGYMRDLAGFLSDLGRDNLVFVVSGGGKPARRYIEAAREFDASEAVCDLIGIDASRMNARLLSAALGDAAMKEPPRDLQKAGELIASGKIVVLGGTHPGHSTDAVSALLAEYVGADLLVNASDVDGIYDQDPQKSGGAGLYKEISVDELLDIVYNKSMGAGEYELVDILAVKIMQRSGIKTIFLNGRDLGNMQKAISGGQFRGTTLLR